MRDSVPSDIQMSGYRISRASSGSGGFRTLDVIVVAACIVLIPSSVAQGLLGVNERTTFALLAPLVLIASLFASNMRVHNTIPTIFAVLMIVGAIASVVASATSQLLMGATLGVAVIVGRQLFLTLLRPKVLRFISWFVLVLLVGGLVGIVYGLLGGQPLLTVPVNYRTTSLYLTTFSFAFVGDFIRPSGIFDEPGSFVMYVAIVTMFNDTLRQNRKLNNVLVILMVFTGALAGLALAAWYLVSSYAVNLRKMTNLLGILFLAFTFLILPIFVPSNMVSTSLDAFYLDRFEVQDGRLVGDNRSGQVEDFFRLVDAEILLRGEKNATRDYETTDQSSHPFSITFGYGLIISIPYFVLLLWLVGITFKQGFRNSYSSIGLLALLLQRPYLYNMYWSIMIAACIWLIYHVANERRSAVIRPA